MTGAEQREERGGEKRLSGGESQKGPRGIRAAGLAKLRKERQGVTGRQGLRAGDIQDRTVGQEEEEGVDEGEFECVETDVDSEATVNSWS